MVRKFGDQSLGDLRGFSTRGTAKENDRWQRLLVEGKQRAEVSVGGDDDPILFFGALENYGVVGLLKSVLAYMDGIVSGLLQRTCDLWRERVVNEELHCPDAGGSTRSRTASAAKRSAS